MNTDIRSITMPEVMSVPYGSLNRTVFNTLDEALQFIRSLNPKVNQEVKILLNLAGAYIVRWE